ncbi:hypothetical protein DID88_008864 [Monilinia fructigena]|uniref:Uncharacterized protein n=1 Tax=Monilinia fructigena TaxID=38457 RepID=A0A395J7Q1_9HELO|nr:hypothetical protein DID88_008864 [Monilinia fructigena]
MQVHGNIQEVIPLSKDIPKNRVELFQASKTAIKQRHEIHGKAQELYGQVIGIHGQVMDVRGQVMGIQGKFQEAQQQTPENAASFKNESKGYARSYYRIYLLHYCVSGLTAQAKKQFKMENGCHHSTQALYNHILPAISTTFTPSLLEKISWTPT